MTEPEPPTVFKAGTPFQLSTLAQGDRADIVALTTSGAAPDLLEVAALELGALGATVDLTGNWAPRKGFDFAGWSEQGHDGRTVRSTVLRRGTCSRWDTGRTSWRSFIDSSRSTRTMHRAIRRTTPSRTCRSAPSSPSPSR